MNPAQEPRVPGEPDPDAPQEPNPGDPGPAIPEPRTPADPIHDPSIPLHDDPPRGI